MRRPASARAGKRPRVVSTRLSPTEQRNPRSRSLDKLPTRKAIRLMLSEEAGVTKAVQLQAGAIEKALELITRALRNGGRLFYVGAGTSGRLGALDASECPPTFRTPPEMVQSIMAGGTRALWSSVELAEDDEEASAAELDRRSLNQRDVVVGIAASGTTPFVWGALRKAKAKRAATVLVCFNPHLRIPRTCRPDVVIAPNLGPEVLTGSTRLKAGTATKIILNLFTTLSMVRLGKVMSNLMIDLNPSNAKLRQRAVSIVCELTGCGKPVARKMLEETGWVVRGAVERLQTRPRRVRQS